MARAACASGSRPPGEPNIRWTTAAAPTPTAKAATTPIGNATPTATAATAPSARIQRPR